MDRHRQHPFAPPLPSPSPFPPVNAVTPNGPPHPLHNPRPDVDYDRDRDRDRDRDHSFAAGPPKRIKMDTPARPPSSADVYHQQQHQQQQQQQHHQHHHQQQHPMHYHQHSPGHPHFPPPRQYDDPRSPEMDRRSSAGGYRFPPQPRHGRLWLLFLIVALAVGHGPRARRLATAVGSRRFAIGREVAAGAEPCHSWAWWKWSG